jgi:hypothetical protein
MGMQSLQFFKKYSAYGKANTQIQKKFAIFILLEEKVMKKLFFSGCFVASLMITSMQLSAQVGINIDGSQPDSSAMLDIKSTSRGFLPPRVALAAINSTYPITNPATGLLVFNYKVTGTPPHNVTIGYYYWNGTRWIPVVSPQGTIVGDMLYWNGTQWVRIPAGNNGEVLTFNNGVPAWGQSPAQLPTLTTDTITSITAISATSGGNVCDGGSLVTKRGICWSIAPNPTVENSKNIYGSGSGTFSGNLSGLAANTPYFVRSFATNDIGTGYGNEMNFTTQNGIIIISTTVASNITNTSAASGGNISNDGGASVTARGVCWDIFANPTIEDNHTIDGDGTGNFFSAMSGLTFATTYYLRAYATNSVSTYYGDQVSFSTLPNLPVVSTTAPYNISGTSATSGGEVISDGGGIVTARGVCWDIFPLPTIIGLHTINGSGSGSFTSNITGLGPYQYYYVRAYATNEAGTAYGTPQLFQTTGLKNPE